MSHYIPGTVIFKNKKKTFDLAYPAQKAVFDRFDKEFNDYFDPKSPNYRNEDSKVEGIIYY